jgi:acyl-CoA synthetase (NDP forming)
MIARMSIRHLDALFDPHSVALIGASDRPGSVGATVWRNLRSAGFEGPCWPVNPRRDTVGGGVIVSFQQIDTVAADQPIAGPSRPPGR